jgi:hypothetical protein
MATRLCKILIIFALMGLPYAQAQVPDNKSKAKSDATDEKFTRVIGAQITTILEFGLAGGAIGLSTLSFYGRPQDKLTYVPIGVAIGIFAGTIYSTSLAVTNPRRLISEESEPLPTPPSDPSLYAFQWKFTF